MKKAILLMAMMVVKMAAMAQEGILTEYSTGLIVDDEAYGKVPLKPELLTREYAILPASVSLQKYCPKVASQGDYGTCTAWSSTYAARTIAEAVKWGWTNQDTITKEAFAPLFVYAQIKVKEDSKCINGTRMNEALDVLKIKGAPKLKNFDTKCASHVPRWIADEAKNYLIDDYFALFNNQSTSINEKINKTKKALSQERPVLVNMYLPRSFYHPGEVWNGIGDINNKAGMVYHAMCVVAYDDNKEGGAFLIMNSWSENWGNRGYTWVKYNDFAKYADYAFELYVKKAKKIVEFPPMVKDSPIKKDTPIAYSNHFSGSLYLQLSTGDVIKQHLNDNQNSWPIYQTDQAFPSRTKYRIFLSNNEPAYVYVIGSDLENHVSKVFPPKDNISPALVYSQNDIALPDEKWWIEMDDSKGKDYLCVLYSNHELPINDIISRIKQGMGNFMNKLIGALGKKDLAVPQEISYDKNEIKFEAHTNGSIVPLVLEVTHK